MESEWIRYMSRYEPFWAKPRAMTFQRLDADWNIIDETPIGEPLSMNEIICDGCNKLIEGDVIPALCYIGDDGQEYVSRAECDECINEYFKEMPKERDEVYLEVYKAIHDHRDAYLDYEDTFLPLNVVQMLGMVYQVLSFNDRHKLAQLELDQRIHMATDIFLIHYPIK
jgi:hypothetical protein